jgi:hypothetical protein
LAVVVVGAAVKVLVRVTRGQVAVAVVAVDKTLQPS